MFSLKMGIFILALASDGLFNTSENNSDYCSAGVTSYVIRGGGVLGSLNNIKIGSFCLSISLYG